MSLLPAAAILEEFDFGRRERGRCPPVASRLSEAPEGNADSGSDAAADREAAFAEGFEKGKAAAIAELDARLEEQRATLVAQAAAERQAWVGQTAGAVADQLAAGLRSLEASIADTAARILEPFLGAELRKQAIADLVGHLDVLLTKDPGVALSMSGPEELLEALRRRVPANAGQLMLVPSKDVDVRICVGQTILETRLRAWMAKIEEAKR
jgi:hypothetical protein